MLLCPQVQFLLIKLNGVLMSNTFNCDLSYREKQFILKNIQKQLLYVT